MPLPDRPADLPQPLHPIWAATITQLQAAGTDRVDPATLVAYSSAVHSHAEATRLVTASGPLIERGGQVVANPAIAVQRDTASVIRNLGRAMGLTRVRAPAEVMGDPDAMRQDPDGGGRWCEEHGRWECSHSRSRGRGPCHGSRKLGTDGCRMHAGRGQAVKHLAAREAKRHPLAVEPLDMAPGHVLLWRVQHLAAMVASVDSIVAGLEAEQVVWGRERTVDRQGGEFPGTETVWAAKLNTWVQYHASLDRALRDACTAALAANVDERMVRIAEAQGAAIVQVMQAIFNDPELGLLPEQRAVLGAVVPRHLRALAS
jgi:phage terminase small subunit